MKDSGNRQESIDARLGAIWIGQPYIEQFLRETLQDESITVTHSTDTGWSVHGGRRGGNASTATWGTAQICAEDIAQLLLQHRPIRVADGQFGLDRPATAAARQKANGLSIRFSEWVWEDSERGADLTRQYNEIFNDEPAPRSYGSSEISMSPSVSLREPDPRMIEVAKEVLVKAEVSALIEAAKAAARAFPDHPTARFKRSSRKQFEVTPPGVTPPADRGTER